MIPVIWSAQEIGRGRYNSTAMLNDMLDGYNCQHFAGLSGIPDGFDGGSAVRRTLPETSGAVVVIHGGRQIGSIERVNQDLKKLPGWAVIICLGDEESSFPVEQLEHPNKKIWVQEPLPGRHDFADRFMINGYGHDHERHIMATTIPLKRDLDWFFGGQVTHERRAAVVDALRTIKWGGVVIETKGYHQGVSLPEYYQMMCRAKIVPCPSGFHSPDAARAWDALECGAVPILDDLSPTRNEPGFWKYVLGEHPLPVTTSWNILPEMIKSLLPNWDVHSTNCQRWWTEYKNNFFTWLGKDIEVLKNG